MTIAIDAREMVGQIAGKGRYVLELVQALAKLDSENQYYLYCKARPTIALPKNFTVVLIGGKPGLRQFWMANDVKRRGCDVFLAPTGYLPAILSRVPTVVTVHDLAIFLVKEARPTRNTYLAERLLLGLAVRRATHIVTVSESTKQDLAKVFGTPKQKISVTLLGYDKKRYQPKASKDDLSVLKEYQLTASQYVLFIGTLEPRKNIVGLITAYARLPKQLRDIFPLAIAGKKGWFYEEIFATVKELDVVDAVHFLGRVPDEHLPALYRQARCFAFPSFYEGFGLPVLEALGCGTPVITSNISSLPEVAQHGGLLVNPKKLETITEALDTLLTDDTRYAEMKKETTTQAASFSWETTAKETLAIFKDIVKQ